MEELSFWAFVLAVGDSGHELCPPIILRSSDPGHLGGSFILGPVETEGEFNTIAIAKLIVVWRIMGSVFMN